jgi:DNA-binding response OmpR family regulator
MSKKVMIVEDTADLLKNISEFLTMDGFDVISCINAQIAIDKLKDEIPDLIITDLSMPVMDGFEFIEKIRTNLLLANIPVAIFSARPMHENEARAISLGVAKYIKKPCPPDELLLSIHEVLKTS